MNFSVNSISTLVRSRSKRDFCTLCFCAFLFTNATANETDAALAVNKYGIIPAPQILQPGSGSFRLSRSTQILVNQDAATEVATYFQALIIPSTRLKLKIVEANAPRDGAVNLLISESISSPEGYELSVNSDRVTIKAAGTAGLFYGIQSLRQMLPAELESPYPFNNVDWAIAGVLIKDEPQFRYRAMHLDTSRHFFSKQFIKQFIDYLALHKMNVFHWHLTDDQGWRIEIRKYPKLTSIGSTRPHTMIGHPYDRLPRFYDDTVVSGYYSQQDIREIVRYASERQVTIVPEIDVPGHTSALLAAYPELGCVTKKQQVKTEFHIFRDVICPTEKSFAFLQDVFTEVAELFPGPYIHIGGDEVIKDQWKACESCAELMRRENMGSYEELQSYFVRRVETIINGLGKKMAGWEEILEGGIDTSATITTWLDIKKGTDAVKAGHDVVIGSSDWLYFNQFESLSLDEPMSSSWQPPITLRRVFESRPVPAGLTDEQAAHILGAQGHVWGNFIKTPADVEHAALPRMSALAEVLWSSEIDRSWTGFLRRLNRFFRRLDMMGANASRAVYKVEAKHHLENSTLILALKVEEDNHAIRYTVDGSQPTAQSPLYGGTLSLNETTTVRAVGQNTVTGELYGDFGMTFFRHKALGKAIRFAHPPKMNYQPGPFKTISDGVIGHDRIFHPTEWAEFYDGNLDATIDFDTETRLRSVGVGFDAGQYRKLNLPRAIEIMTSDDCRTWRTVAEANEQDIVEASPYIELEFPVTTARCLRVVGVNDKQIYSTRLEKKIPVSIFIDEIIVY